jgi:hypothetical protein
LLYCVQGVASPLFCFSPRSHVSQQTELTRRHRGDVSDAITSNPNVALVAAQLSEPENFLIASTLSSLAGRRRGSSRGAACVRETRVGQTRGGSGTASSTAARPGGFGNSDRTLAGLREARVTNQQLNQRRVRRVRAGPFPFPG